MLRLRMRLETSIYEGQNFLFAILFILVAIGIVAITISVEHIQRISIRIIIGLGNHYHQIRVILFFKPIKINRMGGFLRLQQPIFFMKIKNDMKKSCLSAE